MVREISDLNFRDFNTIESIAEPRKKYSVSISERRLFLVVGDLLMAILAAMIAFIAWHVIAHQSLSISTELLYSKLYWFPLSVGLWMCLAWLFDMYDPSIAGEPRSYIQQIVAICVTSLAIGFTTYFFLPNYAPRIFVMAFLPTMSLLVALWRALFLLAIGKESWLHRILVIGDSNSVTELSLIASKTRYPRYKVAAWATESEISQAHFDSNGISIVGRIQAAEIHEVVVSTHQEIWDKEFVKIMIACQANGIRIASMPEIYRRISRQVPVKYVSHDWVLGTLVDHPLFTRIQLSLKRILDLLGCLCGLPILVLLYPFVALAIRLDSPGTILYSQIRSGRGGRNFRIHKFRTMRSDAEKDGIARWAGKTDARITNVGYFLRHSRIDELPQLVNVLRGEMSLVGPRPERPELEVKLEKLLPHYSLRHMVKPGITGWAQIHYKYGDSIEDSLRKLQYDFYYIRYWTLLLDVYILFRTIGVVLGFKGQ